MNLKEGNIIVGDGSDIFDKLQHIVNGKGATHGCFFTYPTGSKRDMPLVLSAEYNGCVHILWKTFFDDDETYNVWCYSIKEATQEEINYALDYCTNLFLNDSYAYLAWPWFGWKRLWESFLNPLGKKFKFLNWIHHDISTENNWFTKHVFCTKQTYIYLDKLTELYPKKWENLRNILHQWLPDTFQPMELKKMLEDNPTIFNWEFQRVDKNINLF